MVLSTHRNPGGGFASGIFCGEVGGQRVQGAGCKDRGPYTLRLVTGTPDLVPHFNIFPPHEHSLIRISCISFGKDLVPETAGS